MSSEKGTINEKAIIFEGIYNVTLPRNLTCKTEL